MDQFDDERRKLATEGVGRVESIRKRYERMFPQHAADIESSAYWGLARAAAQWEPDKGRTWERWADLLIKGEIISYLRSPHVQRYNSEWFEDHEKELVEPKNPAERLEKSEEVERLLAMLPERTARLMRLIYYDGMKPIEAGPVIGISVSHGCKLHQQALAFLKEQAA